MKNKKQCLEIFKQLDLSVITPIRPQSDMGYYCLTFTLLLQEIEEAKKPKLFNFTFNFENKGNQYYRVELTDYFAKILNSLLKEKKIPGYMHATDAKTNYDEKNVLKKIKTEKDAINFVNEFNRNEKVNEEIIKSIFEQVRPYVEKEHLENTINIQNQTPKIKFKV
jgi:hypothetical protein